jgi:hypothetical protein
MTTWCKAVLSVGLTALLAVASAQAEDRISVVATYIDMMRHNVREFSKALMVQNE